MNQDTLKYKVRTKKYLIEGELEKTKIQLNFIENHLKDMKSESKIYWGFLVLPLVLAFLMLILASFMRTRDSLVCYISIIVSVLSTFLWLYLSGFSIYYLMKNYLFKKLQAKSEASLFAEPAVRNPIEILNKPSKQTLFTAHRMTEWKVFRYTHYLEELQKMTEALKGDLPEATLQEFSDKLETFVLYVDIEAEYDLPKRQTLCLKATFGIILLLLFAAGFTVFFKFLLLLQR